jgi:uncharacterized membrane protein YcaP (DUF421 family)
MSTLINALIGYFVLLLVVRALRRRPGEQMTMFEYVLIFLIGGVAILSALGHHCSVTYLRRHNSWVYPSRTGLG